MTVVPVWKHRQGVCEFCAADHPEWEAAVLEALKSRFPGVDPSAAHPFGHPIFAAFRELWAAHEAVCVVISTPGAKNIHVCRDHLNEMIAGFQFVKLVGFGAEPDDDSRVRKRGRPRKE